ncbi:MAG: hypothetical protein M0Z28_13370 [Rhodospirillales bacterium]|nr:hypothetical protein [Rhodospirillales bacterium]
MERPKNIAKSNGKQSAPESNSTKIALASPAAMGQGTWQNINEIVNYPNVFNYSAFAVGLSHTGLSTSVPQ